MPILQFFFLGKLCVSYMKLSWSCLSHEVVLNLTVCFIMVQMTTSTKQFWRKNFNIVFMPVWQVSPVFVNYNICKLNTWSMKLFWSCLLHIYCTHGVINACFYKCEHLRHRTLAMNISSLGAKYSKYFTSPVHSKP